MLPGLCKVLALMVPQPQTEMLPQELKPGAPQRSWVQSQTTFAKLGKAEEGHTDRQTCSRRN